MKHGTKNTTTSTNNKMTIPVDKSLDKYSNVVLFPKKLAKANKLLKGVKLPDNL
ncbi:MAG TPA: hypothetical protein VFW07_02555 [Parafilimonas sp.]|nr:hypothetical protein [Parafilimonas sp.]